jgi:hypothetical protein
MTAYEKEMQEAIKYLESLNVDPQRIQSRKTSITDDKVSQWVARQCVIFYTEGYQVPRNKPSTRALREPRNRLKVTPKGF